METADQAHDAHEAAVRLKDEYGMTEIQPVAQTGDQTGFLICDLDRNSWEVCHRPGRLFDSVFDA